MEGHTGYVITHSMIHKFSSWQAEAIAFYKLIFEAAVVMAARSKSKAIRNGAR